MTTDDEVLALVSTLRAQAERDVRAVLALGLPDPDVVLLRLADRQPQPVG